MKLLPDSNIYFGGINDATDDNTIKNCNIKAILNVSNDISGKYYRDVVMLKFGLEDPKDGHATTGLVDKCVEFLNVSSEIAENLGGNVLIHCIAGKYRSPFIAALWLVKYRVWTLDNAVKFCDVKECREWMKQAGYTWAIETDAKADITDAMFSFPLSGDCGSIAVVLSFNERVKEISPYLTGYKIYDYNYDFVTILRAMELASVVIIDILCNLNGVFLGLFARSQKLIVLISGWTMEAKSVQVVCDRYGILHGDMAFVINELKKLKV